MNKNEKHEDLKVLSGYIYYKEEIEKPENWTPVSTKETNSGFYAEVFSKGNDVAIVIRGTQLTDLGDLTADRALTEECIPIQAMEGKELYEQIKKNYPDSNIVVSGHSLGGSIAQEIGIQTGAETVTFGAYGVGDAHEKLPENTDNITNYGNEKDPVFMSNLDNQVGNTFIITDNKNEIDNNALFSTEETTKNADINTHFVQNMGELPDAIEYKKDSEPGVDNPVLKGHVEYNEEKIFTPKEIGEMTPEEFNQNEEKIMQQLAEGKIKEPEVNYSKYENPVSNTKKIYTREDIEKMPSDEYNKKEQEINEQMKEIGIPSENELKNNPTYKAHEEVKTDIPKNNRSTGQKPKFDKLKSKNNEDIMGYRWIASGDACDACTALDGQIFSTEDDIPELPHPNCECEVEPIYDSASSNNHNINENYEDDEDEDENTQSQKNKRKHPLDKIFNESFAPKNEDSLGLNRFFPQESFVPRNENSLGLNRFFPQESFVPRNEDPSGLSRFFPQESFSPTDNNILNQNLIMNLIKQNLPNNMPIDNLLESPMLYQKQLEQKLKQLILLKILGNFK